MVSARDRGRRRSRREERKRVCGSQKGGWRRVFDIEREVDEDEVLEKKGKVGDVSSRGKRRVESLCLAGLCVGIILCNIQRHGSEMAFSKNRWTF